MSMQRQIDALVHEAVMGRSPATPHDPDKMTEAGPEVPYYSTDNDAAEQIAAHLANRAYVYVSQRDGRWYVTVQSKVPSKESSWHEPKDAESRPMAICLAALNYVQAVH